MDDKSNNSYRSILKATSVFGIMQIIKMIISIITSKFVAVFLGPIGIGLVSLFNNAINIIIAVSNFEFLKISTREIALQNDTNELNKLNSIISVLQKMSIFIGFFGALISIVFSKYLSLFTFGNYDRQNWFVLLSIYFLTISFSNVRLSILQGINNVKLLAKYNILVAFFSAIGTVLIYFIFKIEGIIWAILYSSFVSLFFTIYFTKKYSFNILPISFKHFISESTPIFKLGFLMSLNLIFGQISFFIIKLYLNNYGESTEILGYYEVNSVILINYVGLIFNAMAYDFYPKLASISQNNAKMNSLVNNQIEIAIILITPAVIFLYLTGPLLIKVLYSSDFLNSFEILKLSLFSVILKSVIFPLGYIILVKGNKKLFFKQALISDSINLILSIILYNYFGMFGLGITFILNYLLYGIYIYTIINKEYEFEFSSKSKKLIIVNIVFGILTMIIIFLSEGFISYFLLIIMILVSSVFSFIQLNKRIDIKNYILERIKKRK